MRRYCWNLNKNVSVVNSKGRLDFFSNYFKTSSLIWLSNPMADPGFPRRHDFCQKLQLDRECGGGGMAQSSLFTRLFFS